MGLFKTIVYHKALAQPGVSLLFTALSLLLLVLVLLSVPGRELRSPCRSR